MARFNVIDQDNYVPDAGVVLDTDDIVERDGYRDTKTMVMEMINAGERLIQYRKDEYEYESEDPNFELDPTRAKDFDAIDAERLIALEGKRLARLKAEREAEAAKKAEEKKEDANVGT